MQLNLIKCNEVAVYDANLSSKDCILSTKNLKVKSARPKLVPIAGDVAKILDELTNSYEE